ncbi:MAG: hypothetical protein MZV64_34695 [Ignavibacteriales bacterium]|nr:hypothetical protein [Ignavibacteriales bacterium]
MSGGQARNLRPDRSVRPPAERGPGRLGPQRPPQTPPSRHQRHPLPRLPALGTPAARARPGLIRGEKIEPPAPPQPAAPSAPAAAGSPAVRPAAPAKPPKQPTASQKAARISRRGPPRSRGPRSTRSALRTWPASRCAGRGCGDGRPVFCRAKGGGRSDRAATGADGADRAAGGRLQPRGSDGRGGMADRQPARRKTSTACHM